MACISCQRDDPHDAAGIGVCRAESCGCDGPVSESHKKLMAEIIASHNTITVSRSDLALVLEGWGSDDVSGESLQAYYRLSEVMK